jgi:ABC-2 type transport system ATP-binding protein
MEIKIANGDVKRTDQVAVRTRELTKSFGDSIAVENVTFQVPYGTIFGFIGPSGCGKTTTIRILTGVYHPDAGIARVLGTDPRNFTQRERARIGYMPQDFVLYDQLSVWDNLRFAASIYGVDWRQKNRLQQLLDLVELAEHKRKAARNISGGMRRRLSLASTLAHNPDLFFLDEPTTGVDPVLREKFWGHFRALRDEGRTLFITTQYVSEADYCDTVALLVAGRLIAVNTPQALRHQAFGGEVIDLQADVALDDQIRARMGKLPCVRRVEYLNPNGLRITVEKASTAVPDLIEWTRVHGVAIDSVQQYLPPFDEVFVALVKRDPDG